MGRYLFDQYALLHFSVGVIAYFWGLTFRDWSCVHMFFEIIENTEFGIYFINNWLFFWPGGKPEADRCINILGDNLAGFAGWIVAQYVDTLGVKMGWYTAHRIT